MAAARFVACDYGAESGRVILGTLNKGKITLEEVHRFRNYQVKVFGHHHWDLLYLFDQLKTGLRALASQGHKEVLSIGVDTWGVDYGLIGRDGSLLGSPYTYRDKRTDEIMDAVFDILPRDQLYGITGIQFLQFNTVFQLYSWMRSQSPPPEAAQHLLFMPDLFNYLMTREIAAEYTIASTSQLLDAKKRIWSDEVFEALGLPRSIMAPLVAPGTVLGPLLPEICHETGMVSADLIAPGCHDTASAVVAVPARSKNWAFLSSGTWSLLGSEVDDPIITDESLSNNFTNEGGYGNTIRFLRNNMGMWLLERCRSAWAQDGKNYSYDEVVKMAKASPQFSCFIDPDHSSFLNPSNMPSAIVEFCRSTKQPVPQSEGEFVRCIFESLALKYRYIVQMMNSMRPTPVSTLHIVGGGSQNNLLNQFTADALGIEVIAGPVEATALGNILVQAIAKGELEHLDEGRQVIANSFELRHFEPADNGKWDEAYSHAKNLFS